jgi:hypothetical protein
MAPVEWVEGLSSTTRIVLGLRVVDVDEIAHTVGKVTRGAMLGERHRAPRLVASTKTNRFIAPLRRHS